MTTNRKRANAQRGMSILLVLLVLMMMTAAGLGLMYMSITETGVNSNFRSTLQAYYASKAGLEEARDRMRGAPNAIAPPSTMPTTANTAGVIYIINSDGGTAVQPWTLGNKYFDDELCHENFAALGLTSAAPNIPCSGAAAGYYTTVVSTDPNTGTAAAVPYKWVRINMKQSGSTAPYCVDGYSSPCPVATATQMVCADGFGNEVLLPVGQTQCRQSNWLPVYTITSLAMTNTGARRITQQEVAAISLPPLPGGLTLDGAGARIGTPNSANYGVTGDNANSCGQNPPAGNIPSIGVVNSGDVTDVSKTLARPANYTGSGGTTPDVQNVTNSLGTYSTVGGLQQIVTILTQVADQVVPSGGTPPLGLGTIATPLITVVNGDFTNCTGAGVLVVTGNLTCSGNYSWNGVILVIGKGAIVASNGGGSGQITGGVLIANLFDSSNKPLPPSSPPGIPTFNWNGGGGNGIVYDACWVTKLNNKIFYKVLVSREEMY